MTTLLKLGRSISIALAALMFIGFVGGSTSCASAGEELPDTQPTPTPTPSPDAPVTPTPDAPVPPTPDAPQIPDGGGNGTGEEGSACSTSSQCSAGLCCFGPSIGLPDGVCFPGSEVPGLGCFPI